MLVRGPLVASAGLPLRQRLFRAGLFGASLPAPSWCAGRASDRFDSFGSLPGLAIRVLLARLLLLRRLPGQSLTSENNKQRMRNEKMERQTKTGDESDNGDELDFTTCYGAGTSRIG